MAIVFASIKGVGVQVESRPPIIRVYFHSRYSINTTSFNSVIILFLVYEGCNLSIVLARYIADRAV